MKILETILERKYKEVAENKSLYPIRLLEQSIHFSSPTVSLTRYLKRSDKSGVIAEFKRRSPSKGDINPHASVERVSIGYMQAGASALSILTDKDFFGGNNEDLTTARKFNFCPLLRKDFIVDEYQIVEAKSIGADAILLIAAALTPAQIKNLIVTARSLQLQVVLEVHTPDEVVANMDCEADIVGVNNRDLKTFEVHIDTSKKLSDVIPSHFVKISESGLSAPQDVAELKTYGFEGFLIGENFMKHSRPELAAKEFIQRLAQLT